MIRIVNVQPICFIVQRSLVEIGSIEKEPSEVLIQTEKASEKYQKVDAAMAISIALERLLIN